MVEYSHNFVVPKTHLYRFFIWKIFGGQTFFYLKQRYGYVLGAKQLQMYSDKWENIVRNRSVNKCKKEKKKNHQKSPTSEFCV